MNSSLYRAEFRFQMPFQGKVVKWTETYLMDAYLTPQRAMTGLHELVGARTDLLVDTASVVAFRLKRPELPKELARRQVVNTLGRFRSQKGALAWEHMHLRFESSLGKHADRKLMGAPGELHKEQSPLFHRALQKFERIVKSFCVMENAVFYPLGTPPEKMVSKTQANRIEQVIFRGMGHHRVKRRQKRSKPKVGPV